MNEYDWLSGDDPVAMMRLATGSRSTCCGCIWCDNGNGTTSLAAGQKCCSKCDNSVAVGYAPIASDRKLRLFVCAVAHALVLNRDEIEKAERLAESGSHAGGIGLLLLSDDPRFAARMYCLPATASASAKRTCPPAQRAALLREIVGNPFRPVVLAPEEPACVFRALDVLYRESQHPERQYLQRQWRTPTVLGIARKAYDERPGSVCPSCGGNPKEISERRGNFGVLGHCLACHGTGRIEDGTLCPDTLGVLADALEDAGCPAEGECESCRAARRAGATWYCPCCYGVGRIPNPILAHLRSPGPHVRGCWVLDLILGKE